MQNRVINLCQRFNQTLEKNSQWISGNRNRPFDHDNPQLIIITKKQKKELTLPRLLYMNESIE